MMHMWESVRFSHHVGSRDWTEVMRLGLVASVTGWAMSPATQDLNSYLEEFPILAEL